MEKNMENDIETEIIKVTGAEAFHEPLGVL